MLFSDMSVGDIKVICGKVPDADRLFRELLTIDWEKRPNTPRQEYYAHDKGVPYTYGKWLAERTYESRPWTSAMTEIRSIVRDLPEIGIDYDIVFLNRYDSNRDGIGWHSDDEPTMDPAFPICIVSLGEVRRIQFRKRPDVSPGSGKAETTVEMPHGSIVLMPAGHQQTHQHSIPKEGRVCKTRISLTFRKYKAPR